MRTTLKLVLASGLLAGACGSGEDGASETSHSVNHRAVR